MWHCITNSLPVPTAWVLACSGQALWILWYACLIPVLVYMHHFSFSNTILQIQIGSKYPLKRALNSFLKSKNHIFYKCYPYCSFYFFYYSTMPQQCFPYFCTWNPFLSCHQTPTCTINIVLTWPSLTSFAFPKFCWARKYRSVVVLKIRLFLFGFKH